NVIITLAADSAYSLSAQAAATVTITDNDPPPPTVSVVATDAAAGESTSAANPGAFTFTRTGDTSLPLTVNYTVGGSATNGSDYELLSGSVTLPAGLSFATIPVSVIDDA